VLNDIALTVLMEPWGTDSSRNCGRHPDLESRSDLPMSGMMIETNGSGLMAMKIGNFPIRD
jgi:hypothetical protein